MKMADENENAQIMVDGEMVSLADLAGISMDTVQELRSEPFPKGVYNWEVDTNTPPHIAVIGEDKNAKGAAIFKFKCLEVLTMTDADYTGKAEDLVGKFHQETFFLTTIEGLGYLKAFLKDIGAPYDPNLKKMLFNSAGTRFQAPIMKRKDKNDSDKVYTNVNRGKLKPIMPPGDKLPGA